MMPWLEGTALATWVRESPSLWAYPTVLTLHTVGLGIVVGASAVIDLRLLGYAPRIRIGTLAPLFTFMAYAFVLNAATGIMLFMADATTKSTQPVFYIKLTLIFVALWCTFATRRIVHDNPERRPPSTWCLATPPAGGRVAAAMGERHHGRSPDGLPVRNR